MSQHSHFVGVDVGLEGDYTALAVVRRGSQPDPGQLPDLHVVDLQRTRGKTFLVIAEEIQRLVAHLDGAAVAIDATGIGEGAWQECRRIGMRPVAIVIGGGSKVGGGNLRWTVPHATLYETCYGVFAAGRYKIARDLQLVEQLMRELQTVQAKRTVHGAIHYEVARTEEGHGDVLMSLCLATLLAEREGQRMVLQQRAAVRRSGKDRPPGARRTPSAAREIIRQRLEVSRRQADRDLYSALWRD